MFKKKERVCFFEMFSKSTDFVCNASEELLSLVENYSNIDIKIGNIKSIEKKADTNCHEIYKELNKSFITPIDREDILKINSELDTVIDNIEEISQKFYMFNIREIETDLVQMVALVVKMTRLLKSTIIELKNFKKSKVLKNKIISINSLEEEGDILYIDAVNKLFSKYNDPIYIFKWYHIFESLENCFDSCESVANTIEDVILKNS
ncbi:MAG: DUF47 family protein [Clostridia bacterium]|nr:DUF47 family protein [Clostridia bacterium]